MINAFPPEIQRKPENGERKKEKKKRRKKKKERRREGKRKERIGGGLNVHQPVRPKRPPHRAA